MDVFSSGCNAETSMIPQFCVNFACHFCQWMEWQVNGRRFRHVKIAGPVADHRSSSYPARCGDPTAGERQIGTTRKKRRRQSDHSP